MKGKCVSLNSWKPPPPPPLLPPPPPVYKGGLTFQNFSKKDGLEFSHKKREGLVKRGFALKKRDIGISLSNTK